MTRLTQSSVDIYLTYQGKYLFLKRSMNKRNDPGKLSPVGGRIEMGEHFAEAALREVEEETGYVVPPEALRFCGMVTLEGELSEDWVIGIFVAEVESSEVPLGLSTDDGELVWLDPEEVLARKEEINPDLTYYLEDIFEGKAPFFAAFVMGPAHTIKEVNITRCI